MQTITPKQAEEKLQNGALLLDVRTPAEFNAFHINGNVKLLPHTEIQRVVELIPNKTTVIVTTCRSGMRAAYATEVLTELGYQNVFNLEGGLINFNKYLLSSNKSSLEEYIERAKILEKHPGEY